MSLAIALCAGLGACGIPQELARTHRRPIVRRVVGTYVPDRRSLRWIHRSGHYADRPMWIELHDDGTCRFVAIPDWWITDFGKSQRMMQSGTGTWRLEKDFISWQVRLEFGDDTSAPDSVLHGRIGDVHLLHQRPPYALELGVGDPDSDEAMVFERLGDRR